LARHAPKCRAEEVFAVPPLNEQKANTSIFQPLEHID
jgi:hypothetical protein